MTTKHPTPRALFDTLDQISSKEILPCVADYLEKLAISDSQKEYNLACEFLLSYAGSLDTFNAYRREIERLLHWSWLITKKPIKDLTRNDMRDYLNFVSDPPLTWIGEQNSPRFNENKDGTRSHHLSWRPFIVRISKAARADGTKPEKSKYQLSNKSIQALFAGLSTFFTYLQQEEYMDVNPIVLIRQKNRYLQKTQTQKVTRKLSPLQWTHVIEITEQLTQKNSQHERLLFIMSAFYLLGLRISELAETPGRYPKMSDFAPDKRGLWWFTTVGKGNKVRDVAVPDDMLQALKRYRLSIGLTALPSRGENTPLLHKQRGHGGIGTRQVRYLVQYCFDQAEQNLRAANLNDEAEDLRAATVHWLRHTAISADVEFRPREHVRDDVGHENPATTERYIDTDRLARHQSAQHKQLKPKLEPTT
jgi:site-specific recombinase XerD